MPVLFAGFILAAADSEDVDKEILYCCVRPFRDDDAKLTATCFIYSGYVQL
jgi:hypothetical protein